MACPANAGLMTQELTHVLRQSGPMMVPSIVYLIMNWFSLFAFTHVDASTFAMVRRTCCFVLPPNPEPPALPSPGLL